MCLKELIIDDINVAYHSHANTERSRSDSGFFSFDEGICTRDSKSNERFHRELLPALALLPMRNCNGDNYSEMRLELREVTGDRAIGCVSIVAVNVSRELVISGQRAIQPPRCVVSLARPVSDPICTARAIGSVPGAPGFG